MPMRTRSSGCFFNSRAISIAHFTGASGLVPKTSAPPSPVGRRINFPSRCAIRNVSVARATSRNFSKYSELLVNEQFGITDDVDEQNVPDLELHIGLEFGR